MYRESVRYYDEIYSYKNYKKEAEKIHRIIRKYKTSVGNSLLDVACGTGNHMQYLKRNYQVEGLDINPEMLRIARRKLPGVPFHRADMAKFDFGRQYDAIVCLFSAIGFVHTVARLNSAMRSFAKHVCPGGVIIVEPWFSPRTFKTGTVHANFVDKPNLKIARISTSLTHGEKSLNKMHYLIGTPSGVDYFTEDLELRLFTKGEYLESFRAAGLATRYDLRGLTGRGLYIGTRRK
jgi:SAM-dependent methyltransferase